jgi:hypothetical protein
MKIDFKTYLPIIAIVVSVGSVWLAFSQTERTRIEEIRPILVFVYDLQQGWLLKNIGNGPGLNILVAEKLQEEENWTFPVRVPSIAKEGNFPLKWVRHANVKGLGVTYEDFQKRPYTTITINDQSKILDGRHLPTWTQGEITPHWKAPGRMR